MEWVSVRERAQRQIAKIQGEKRDMAWSGMTGRGRDRFPFYQIALRNAKSAIWKWTLCHSKTGSLDNIPKCSVLSWFGSNIVADTNFGKRPLGAIIQVHIFVPLKRSELEFALWYRYKTGKWSDTTTKSAHLSDSRFTFLFSNKVLNNGNLKSLYQIFLKILAIFFNSL